MDKSQLTTQDYIYCSTCNMVVDLWKYDHDIDAAGHEGCEWRYVTEDELPELISECEELGCFAE